MSRLADWWRRVNATPQPSPSDPGRAAVAYPELSRTDRAAFLRCEGYLLWEIVDSRSSGRQIAGRGDAPATNGWVVVPGRVHSGLIEDTKGKGPGPAVMVAVVQWLVDAGALRPLTASVRAAIAESTVAERLRDLPEYHRTEADARRAWDDDLWEVDPQRMLVVYPHLAAANADWRRAAGR
ncbi:MULTISPECIES: hypothetical protein [unclassified Curtobacterium]|uniref:hypothetical protein n=1 Tax=unclassified Curtobacterium TaxID=257496 RepID=UPI0008DE1287|nr:MULTISPECIES: hypothetical protein [unclassified Curtobacterium]OIH98571.1 hypothetical protein BIU92_12535 [Curtobacterium sp. MCBA15_003]OII12759.1 hypothetical protein BIU97_02035 [Curtobacterium sp. MCBA15_009]OII32296.1 hypothetical protein BIU94_02865 [Curtobacterium sp. MMLR14_006]